MSTMRDVAALSGVSAKTVSRVFNEDPHVLPETRARVQASLRQLNYIPNALARNFRTGTAPSIGIAVPDIEDPFFAAVIKSVDRIAATRDLSTVVTNIGLEPHREPELVDSLLRRQLGGLIIAPVSRDHSFLRLWLQRVPTVFVDRMPGGIAADSFTDDDGGGGYLATAHLIEHGHRRIAFVGDSSELQTEVGRLKGYRKALVAHDIHFEAALVAFGAKDRDGAALALSSVRSARPTAVFASNARTSIALVPALRGTGLALVGFGDFPMADMLTPSVTVIDQDPSELGALAAQRLLDRLDRPQGRFRRRTVLPVRLVERESCRVAAACSLSP